MGFVTIGSVRSLGTGGEIFGDFLDSFAGTGGGFFDTFHNFTRSGAGAFLVSQSTSGRIVLFEIASFSLFGLAFLHIIYYSTNV